MKIKKPINYFTLATACILSTSVLAVPSADAKPKPKPLRAVSLIKASRHVINLERCNHEDLSIKVKIPRQYKTFWNKEADAHLVAAFPSDEQTGAAEFQSWNLSDILIKDQNLAEQDKEHPLFQLSCDFLHSLPLGAYQLSLVMTVTDGDPTDLWDWHHGFRGLLATSKIKINKTQDESDLDGDGEVDGDLDQDGELENEEIEIENDDVDEVEEEQSNDEVVD